MSTSTLRTATTLLVGAIAALAFLVSFEAISDYAVRVGAFSPGLRWAAPLLVDTFTVAATLVILARSRDGVRAVYAWSLVVIASTVSVALNVAHAPPHLAARMVAALPPAELLAALELVMSEARRLRERTERADETAEETAEETPDGLERFAADLQGTARERLRAILAAAGQQPLSVRQAARLLHISPGHAGRLLAAERPSNNGDHAPTVQKAQG
jgi:Protein of unknown function (DUF2637)